MALRMACGPWLRRSGVSGATGGRHGRDGQGHGDGEQCAAKDAAL